MQRGEKSSTSVGIMYRDLHPSHLGRLDINTCSSSDPGMGGILVPFIEMDGMYFDGQMEVQDWVDRFEKYREEYNLFGHKYIPEPFIDFNIDECDEIVKLLDDINMFIDNNDEDEEFVTAFKIDDDSDCVETLKIKSKYDDTDIEDAVDYLTEEELTNEEGLIDIVELFD